MFVPAVVEASPSERPSTAARSGREPRRSSASGIELEIGGVEVRIGANADPQAIMAVIRALKDSR
jgi:hypothetical protein